MKIIAIDPGAAGGIAASDGVESTCISMPETLGDLVDELVSIKANGYDTCYLEQVVGFIPMASPGAMFSFGQSFGQIQGVLQALHFRVIEVRPTKWQKELSLGAKKDYPKTKWKNHLKEVAQKLYPHLKVTLKTADALLLLHYAEKQQ